jgi:hypothetical protein
LDPSIDEAVAIVADGDAVEDTTQQDRNSNDSEWNPKNAPTQVQLVELLQFIDEQRQDRFTIPIALIVSAWDLYVEDYASPDQWLSERLPLLDQYLRTNAERFPLRVYGVSAQGAPLDGDLTGLQSHEHQSDRIMVKSTDCIPHDITCPVRWIIEARSK